MASYESLRMGAHKRGWRFSQRGSTYRFTDADGRLLHAGDFPSATAFLASQPKLPLGPARKLAPPAWVAAIDAYLLTVAAAGHRGHTLELYRSLLGHMARGLGCPPADVTAEMLVGWFGSQTQWGAEHRRKNRSVAKGFFTWAYRTGRVPAYLGDELPRVRQGQASPRPAPDDAWEAALAAADARATLMLRLAAEAGLRRAEVAQVHTRDVIVAGGMAQLVVHGKGGRQRIVPISGVLAALIRRGPAGHTPGASSLGWLFPNQLGGHLSPRWVGTMLSNLMPEGYTMHTLRHRFASRAYRGTRNLRAVQTLLGHASIATTEPYTAVDDDEIRAAAASAW
jgi:integrase